MAKPRLAYLSEREQAFIHAQAVRLLEEVGIAFNSRTAIELLAAAGAQVDRDALTAKLPWDIVQQCIDLVPKRILLAGRDPRRDVVVDADREDPAPLFCTDGAATYMLDDTSGERHEGTAHDLRQMMRLFDALSAIDFVWPTITPHELEPSTAGLELAHICLANCGKHLQDEVRLPDQAPYFIELLETVAGASLAERPIYSVTNCTIAPLQHDGDMTEAHIVMARAGVPILLLPMPQTGTTGPMSVLGTVIIGLAELLSAVAVYQLAAPGCGLIAGCGAAVAEMRSGLYLCGTPEVGLINLATVEMGRRYGIPTLASAVSSDAKAADMQAGIEGMLTGMAGALGGADIILAFGILDGAQTASLAKTVLDADLCGMLRRFLAGGEIDRAHALVDDIVEVGAGGHFLDRRSTRALARSGELWSPAIFRRGSYESYSGSSLREEAAARARAILGEHEVAPLEDDVERRVREIIARYAASRA